MKFKEIFEQVKNYFNLDATEQLEQDEKRDELLESVEDKIKSKKEKLKDATSKKKKEKLKKEIDILKDMRKKLTV